VSNWRASITTLKKGAKSWYPNADEPGKTTAHRLAIIKITPFTCHVSGGPGGSQDPWIPLSDGLAFGLFVDVFFGLLPCIADVCDGCQIVMCGASREMAKLSAIITWL